MTPVTVVLWCEAKDEYSEGAGREPRPGEIAPVIQDIMTDVTRGDFELPWMVRRVEEVTP